MLRFKVLVIQRGKAFLGVPCDVSKSVIILGASKKEILKKARLAILEEVKERRELFVPNYKASIESIVREKNVKTEDGDKLTLEQVEIEFTYNNVRLGEIQWFSKKEIKTINLVLISFPILYISWLY